MSKTRMTYDQTTVKINLAQLEIWCEQALARILKDLKNPKCHLYGRQDYFTATDLEACVRLIAAESVGERLYCSKEIAGWWGYGAGQGVRIKIVDKQYRSTLLGECRDFLRDKLSSGTLEGHNFGRGHCSGMRFRPRVTGISETEKKTIKASNKPKPRHLRVKLVNSSYGHINRALCQTKKKQPKGTSFRSYQRNGVWTTEDPEQVTCKHCLSYMKKDQEAAVS